MKKPHYLLLLFTILFHATSTKSQPVVVSGGCITGSILLNPGDSLNGRPAYEGIGTAGGLSGVKANIYWLIPGNVWVLSFGGQPYFKNSCNTISRDKQNVACPWTPVDGHSCTGTNPLTINDAGASFEQLTDFTARADNKQIIINWRIAGETNNKDFNIQRSPDGTNWDNIGFASGSLNSSSAGSYQFSDLTPLQGKNFYRLRQVDRDGKYSYYIVAPANFLKSGFYAIYGNPGNGQFRLHIEAGTEKFEFSVIDAGGKQIVSKINNASGDEIIDLSNFPSGIYLLRLIKGSNLFIEKLVKF